MTIKNLKIQLIKNLRHLLAVVLLLSGYSTYAAEISFTASVNRNPIGTNEQFSITFTINTRQAIFRLLHSKILIF